MVITPHMLVGAAIASYCPNVWTAFLFSWASHYILDFLPHWDYPCGFKLTSISQPLKTGLDFLIGLVLICIFIRPIRPLSFKKILVFIGAIASLTPDFLEVFYYTFDFKLLYFFHWLHASVHHPENLSFWAGLPLVLLIGLISIIILRDRWG